ncbi:MAG: methyltransferase domain-containing protein [Planctomycetota bacterium]
MRDGVRAAYSAAATYPDRIHAFPVGRGFAESLGYPKTILDSLPPEAVEAFAGVSNVSVFAEVPPGASVLDLGCGAGLDSIILARRVGPAGCVMGIDFSEAMLARARAAASAAGCSNLTLRLGEAETLPCPAASIDVAIVNGIFNLNPFRTAVFSELARVMKPGGVAFVAELVLTAPLPRTEQENESNWFA